MLYTVHRGCTRFQRAQMVELVPRSCHSPSRSRANIVTAQLLRRQARQRPRHDQARVGPRRCVSRHSPVCCSSTGGGGGGGGGDGGGDGGVEGGSDGGVEGGIKGGNEGGSRGGPVGGRVGGGVLTERSHIGASMPSSGLSSSSAFMASSSQSADAPCPAAGGNW